MDKTYKISRHLKCYVQVVFRNYRRIKKLDLGMYVGEYEVA
jgi:hypothetical protein